jgi:membrane-bound lytic murein transglycosylase F
MYKLKSLFLFCILCIIITACNNVQQETTSNAEVVDIEQIKQRDTLIIGTIYGSSSYFLYRDEYMGFDFEVAQHLAQKMGVKLKVIEKKSELELEQLLQERKVDIVCYNIIETKELKNIFNFVFPQDNSYQVLVQNITAKTISDVTMLNGKNIYVVKNSIFEQRLQNLNDELGNVINITQADDSLSSEDLIEMVALGKIEYTIAYYRTAQLYKTLYKKLDNRLKIGFEQNNGWLIRKESKNLYQFFQEWEKSDESANMVSSFKQKYWVNSLFHADRKVKIPKGAISPYDHFFKKYAKEINWDWRMLAAVAFHESQFDSSQVSWAGAAGIMQLMPRTAANFGLNKENIQNPELNIEAGVQYIKSLNLTFQKIADKEERIKFILAAYNSGPAHILDAMALARKYGKNPNIWFGHVDYFLIKKSEPEFYNDPVVKYGRFRSKETINYVQNTLETYSKYSGKNH